MGSSPQPRPAAPIWRSLLILAVTCLLSSASVSSADVDYSVQEHSPPGSLIGNIATSIDLANLVSPENLPQMKYSFLNTESSLRNLFVLDDKTGDLRLSRRTTLDRELVCPFSADCVLELQVAIQSTISQFFRKVFVNVDVIDINDHAPTFRENVTKITISESVQIPTSFPLPSAVDEDRGSNNSLQGYEILPADGPFRLSYSKSNSNLMLEVVSELDHEKRDSYRLKIIARDGGEPVKEGVLTVEIDVEDVNDNKPVFTETNYARTVDETVSQGSLLLTLTATDEDSGDNGKVRYHLPEQLAHVMSMFSLNATSGELRLVGDFQTADTEVYVIRVEASDQAYTTTTTVTIRVEDTINSEPKLLVSYLSPDNFSSITEYANLGVAVAHILIKDTDRGPNGIVTCRMATPQYFELQGYDVKEYKVIVAHKLDRETISVHNVTVECEDAGQPSLTASKTFQVKVTDENDNPPAFKERLIHARIEENNELGAELTTVSASDPDDPALGNGRITYSLEDVSEGEFLIDPVSGTIKVMKSLDYEHRRQVNFTVIASDNGTPRRSARVALGVSVLDLNDMTPHFAQSSFSIRVSERTLHGELIGELSASDYEQGKNGQFDISVVPGSYRVTETRRDPGSEFAFVGGGSNSHSNNNNINN
ncbi:protocadherin gamma-A10, partial [Aplysia californica]|uniref:Protocadherin gamma-A10 n=1 Tax=Aplysia californica TaxID=6500 RepID=A0ABM1ACB4_APLCA